MSDPLDIREWRRIGPLLTTSGQPTAAQLRRLAEIGVRHIVNLAPHDRPGALADEAADVAAAGMAYIHIPVDFEAPTEADFQRFSTAMAAIGEAPAHVHCMVNARVSAFVYRWRRDVLGVDEAVARAAMETVWCPGGVWAAFVGDAASVGLPHRRARG